MDFLAGVVVGVLLGMVVTVGLLVWVFTRSHHNQGPI